MPIVFPGYFIALVWFLSVLAPILLPTFAGLWYGRSFSRISTRESLLVGMAIAAATYFLGVGGVRFAFENGLWMLAYGAIPVYLVSGVLVPKFICARIDRARSKESRTNYPRESDLRKDFWLAVAFVLIFIAFAARLVPWFW